MLTPATAATTETLSGVVTSSSVRARVTRTPPTSTSRCWPPRRASCPLSDDGRQLTPGERVTVEVEQNGDEVEVVDVVTSYAAKAGADIAADIDREVYVAIVSPAGYTLDQNATTVDTVRRYIEKASDYWSSQTGGTIRFAYAGTVPKYVSKHVCGDTVEMWDEAVTRFADAGVDVTGVGKYLILVGPDRLV